MTLAACLLAALLLLAPAVSVLPPARAEGPTKPDQAAKTPAKPADPKPKTDAKPTDAEKGAEPKADAKKAAPATKPDAKTPAKVEPKKDEKAKIAAKPTEKASDKKPEMKAASKPTPTKATPKPAEAKKPEAKKPAAPAVADKPKPKPPAKPKVTPLAPIEKDIRPLLVKYCNDCHNKADPSGELDLDKFATNEQVLKHRDVWEKVIARVQNKEMPPEDSEQLSEADQARLVAWIGDALAFRDCGKIDPGPRMVRRLNRTEYGNTISDLLGVQYSAGEALPVDGAGGGGFDNNADTLFLSPVLIEKYLEAADDVVKYVLADPPLRKKLVFVTPNEKLSADEAAKQVLRRFIEKAFRRPVPDDEFARYFELYKRASDSKLSFEESIGYAVRGVLISPNFLFLVEEDRPTNEAYRVNDFELASRLSYFLWSTMPDDELFKVAKAGKLKDPAVLQKQVERMLKNKKSFALAENFGGQWLGFRKLGREIKPDRQIFKKYSEGLQVAMRLEPAFFIDNLFRENRSLFELIDSDYSYLNPGLAGFYGVKWEGEKNRAILRQVPLNTEQRGGILGMAAILTVTSYPNRTSPVLRGKWVLEELLGAAPPPPPPNVDPLPEEDPKKKGELTLRQRLEAHREKAECASCHNRMDPIGFGLENYDGIGQWRVKDGKTPVDSVGELPSGEKFSNPKELKQVLMSRKEAFVRNLSKRLLAYALCRGLEPQDLCALDAIEEQVQASDYKAQSLIMGIVTSVPFQYRRGSGESKEKP